MKNNYLFIFLVLLEIILIVITFLFILPIGNQLLFSVFILITLLNSIIIIIFLNNDFTPTQLYISPIEFFYDLDNDEVIKIINKKIEKLKYKKISADEEIYMKKEFNGSLINQKLILLFSNKYDQNIKEKIDREVEKCKKENKCMQKSYKRNSIQIIVIVDELEIDVEKFYEVKDIYSLTSRYGNQVPYGIYIPTIIDKKNKRIIISGFKTCDESNFITFNRQKNKIIKILKNIK